MLDIQSKEALEQAKKDRANKQIVIDDRVYEITLPKHYEALAYLDFAENISNGNISLGSEEFEITCKKLESKVVIDKMQLSKISDDHWEAHPKDFMAFVGGFLAVIAVPFL